MYLQNFEIAVESRVQQVDEEKSWKGHQYQFCELFKNAWMKSATAANAESAFKATGIFPLNEDIIPSVAFEASETTNRPVPEMSASPTVGGDNIEPSTAPQTVITSAISEEPVADAGPDDDTEVTEPVASPSVPTTFADIVPLPIAVQRSNRPKPKRKTGDAY